MTIINDIFYIFWVIPCIYSGFYGQQHEKHCLCSGVSRLIKVAPPPAKQTGRTGVKWCHPISLFRGGEGAKMGVGKKSHSAKIEFSYFRGPPQLIQPSYWYHLGGIARKNFFFQNSDRFGSKKRRFLGRKTRFYTPEMHILLSQGCKIEFFDLTIDVFCNQMVGILKTKYYFI